MPLSLDWIASTMFPHHRKRTLRDMCIPFPAIGFELSKSEGVLLFSALQSSETRSAEPMNRAGDVSREAGFEP